MGFLADMKDAYNRGCERADRESRIYWGTATEEDLEAQRRADEEKAEQRRYKPFQHGYDSAVWECTRGLFGISDLDQVFEQQAPHVTAAIHGTRNMMEEQMKKLDGQLATDQQYRELKGRYDELERRYQELQEQQKRLTDILERMSQSQGR